MTARSWFEAPRRGDSERLDGTGLCLPGGRVRRGCVRPQYLGCWVLRTMIWTLRVRGSVSAWPARGAGAWGGRRCLGSGSAEVFLAEHGQFAVGRGE